MGFRELRTLIPQEPSSLSFERERNRSQKVIVTFSLWIENVQPICLVSHNLGYLGLSDVY